MIAEGYRVQFVVLADFDATDFVGITSVPIFRDATPARTAWMEMQAAAFKHDTFVFSREGTRALFWDASSESLSSWSADIAAVVEQLGK